MLTIPVHATVMILGLSIVPQLTITGGTGASRALPFQTIFRLKDFLLFQKTCVPSASFSFHSPELYLIETYDDTEKDRRGGFGFRTVSALIIAQNRDADDIF